MTTRQFEDFSSDNAGPILAKYRNETLCFNDDIQGTGCVALAGLLSALKLQGLEPEALKEQRVLVAGAGSAGLGVAAMLVQVRINVLLQLRINVLAQVRIVACPSKY